MLIEKIRQQTRPNHEALEHAMSPFIMQVSNVNEYARLLRFFYGYFKPVQRAIDQALDREKLPDYDQRRKPEWILRDLQDLGEKDHAGIPLYTEAPSVNDPAEAIGALYVLEGSSLGGKVICNIIAGNLGIPDKKGLSFFYGYGPAAAVKWKDFMAVINSYTDAEDEEHIVTKANEVFAGFHQWFRINYSQSKQ
jgi:heme oxygenase